MNNEDEKFDPISNYEDAELLDQAKKLMKASQYAQQEEIQKYNDKMLNDLWQESLREEGLDPASYGNLAAQDPEHVRDLLKDNMKRLVTGVKKGRQRDPRTGQFVKGSPAPRAGHTPQHRETSASSDRLDELREKSRTRHLTEDESIEAVEHLIGKLI